MQGENELARFSAFVRAISLMAAQREAGGKLKGSIGWRGGEQRIHDQTKARPAHAQ